MWAGFIRFKIETSEHDNKTSGSIKCEEVLHQLIDYQLLKELFELRGCIQKLPD
jgi:hypothetical protein